MLTHRLMPRELVFAAAIAVPLGTVPNAVRLAALLMISSGEREALRLAVARLAPLALIVTLITVSSGLGPSTIDTLALGPEGHQHEQQPGRDGRGRHDWLRRPEKKFRIPLKVLGTVTVPFGLFALCKICKIRQVVFTTFLNWLLKTLLKRICTEGRNVEKSHSREGCSLRGAKRGLNFCDYSNISPLPRFRPLGIHVGTAVARCIQGVAFGT
jgi:hypothetical protein